MNNLKSKAFSKKGEGFQGQGANAIVKYFHLVGVLKGVSKSSLVFIRHKAQDQFYAHKNNSSLADENYSSVP